MVNWSELIMRVGLGIVFLNSGIGKLFLNVKVPVDKIITFLPADTTLLIMGLLEFVLGVLFVLGLFTKLTGKVAAVLLLAIILSGVYLQMFNVILKDIVLFAVALYLAKEGSKKLSLDSIF